MITVCDVCYNMNDWTSIALFVTLRAFVATYISFFIDPLEFHLVPFNNSSEDDCKPKFNCDTFKVWEVDKNLQDLSIDERNF